MNKILKSVAVIAFVAAIAVGATSAYFSDTATSSTNTFTSGTLSLKNEGLVDAPAITIPNMAPGDVSPEYSIIIKNDGSMNLAWLGNWQFDGGVDGETDLKNALYIDYAKMEFLAPNGTTSWLDDATTGYGPVSGPATDTNGQDVFIENGTGHGPYSSWYTTLAGASPFGVVSFNKWNDNAGMVPGSVYEHAGALKPGYSYKLTVKFGMAAGATDLYQGLGPVTAKLQVNATQLVSSQISALTGSWADMTWLNNQIADQVE